MDGKEAEKEKTEVTMKDSTLPFPALASWARVEFQQTPIYIQPEAPDWFVPNRAADLAMTAGGPPSAEITSLLRRVDTHVAPPYHSRTDILGLSSLKECWLHITNQCNLTCRHCMFQSSPAAREKLSAEDCLAVIREAYALGCRIFYFTGGEPMMSDAFLESLKEIFRQPDTHGVVLTNLTLIRSLADRLRAFPPNRLHFQVSVDGLGGTHDAIRGAGTFDQLKDNLAVLKNLGFPATLSTTVTRQNVHELPLLVDFASAQQVATLHLLWLFKKGNADTALVASPADIFPHLTAAQQRAEAKGVTIDNVESLHAQVFSYPGTRHDLSNAGWQSLAVGPDRRIYPTPALIYTAPMQCGHIRQGLEQVWKGSPVLAEVRKASLNQSERYRNNAFRYLVGGGDIDHSYVHTGRLTGGDPYLDLYTDTAKWLIAREAHRHRPNGYPAIRLKMGERVGSCPAEGGTIFFTHSNCVLSLPGTDTHTQVNRFYSEAAEETKEDILNPVCYDAAVMDHIPAAMRYRSYGCGSPVLEADVRTGETVVDLGSGTGIECFIAGRLVGAAGRVVGIDMGDTMLALAEKAREQVAGNLGYANVSFKKAFLESLPLEDASVDVVISNCVVNLSPDKRRVFSEIFRVLKPGGRLVISDITFSGHIPIDIKYNESLRGECIGGALGYMDLFGLLNDTGFSESEVLKGYLYRTVKGHDFYSVTYRAFKPVGNSAPRLFGFPAFDRLMAAVESAPTCACFCKPETDPAASTGDKKTVGCMVCGAPLVYLSTNETMTCHYCGKTVAANARCGAGHFVCDPCHGVDILDVMTDLLLGSREPDAVALMARIRANPRFPMHGPEHHALVPGVILTALRNAGADVTDAQIVTGIRRGQTIAGGACAFFGACGAAMGVGIAVSLLTGATPLDGAKRQVIQQVTGQVLEKIAAYDAPRCCQRDAWLSLKAAAVILRERLHRKLTVSHPLSCEQFSKNKECIHNQCPLWPKPGQAKKNRPQEA